MTLKISVVMGVYNGSRYLSETIDSVLCQTEAGFEFIIVDDGSTDAQVARILSVYEKNDDRIRVISKSNAGLTKALIEECAAAKGKYIARIDAGDVMMPERLARQRAVLDEHPEVDLVTCWTECCGPEWEHLYTTKEKGITVTDESVWVANVLSDQDNGDLLEGPSHHGSVMFRADAYRNAGGYRAAFYYGQDWDLWYRLAEVGKFAGIREVLYRCRIFPEGISMQNVERQRQIHVCSRGAFLARRRGEDETPFLERAAAVRPRSDGGGFHSPTSERQRLAAGYYFVGEALRRKGDPRCQYYFKQAILMRPFHIRSWVRCVQGLFV